MAESFTAPKCPACLGDFKGPKILLCGHTICEKCVLDTLKSESEQPTRCPVCRQLILTPQEKYHIDFSDFVDNLPTDYVTQIKVECHAVLSGGTVCNICDNDSDSLSFCFQCRMKLCTSCLKCHNKIPSLFHHTVELFKALTADQFTTNTSIPCDIHKEKSSEMYCSDHGKLVCSLCAASVHKKCKRVENIPASAAAMRRDMTGQMQRLSQREISVSAGVESLNKQMTDAERKFEQMKKEVVSKYGSIINMFENQKHRLLDDIIKEEQAFFDEKVANRDKLVAFQSAIATHAVSIHEMISSAPEMALLATLGQLKSQLDDLEMKTLPVDSGKVTLGHVCFDEEVLDQLENLVGSTAVYITCEQTAYPAQSMPSADEQRRASTCNDAEPSGSVHPITGKSVDPPVATQQGSQAAAKPVELLEIKGSLFGCPVGDAMAHCVSEDLEMNEGLAAMFKEYFGGVAQLRAQEKKVGEVACLFRDGNFVYYLITKRRVFGRPIYESISSCLIAMKTHMMANKVTALSMPTIGCGWDGLDWNVVSDIIREVFRDTGVRITIYHFDEISSSEEEQ